MHKIQVFHEIHIFQKILLWFVMAGLLWFVQRNDVSAAEQYVMIVEDDADLLTDAQEEELRVTMAGVTQHGNAVFKTIGENAVSTEQYAQNYYLSNFGAASGVIFLIDMDNRNIWLQCYGNAELMIPNAYAEIITDNVYTYATKGDYFSCANIAFSQIETKIEGGRISQPMKYICNALFAVGLALFFNFFLMRSMSAIKQPKEARRREAIRKRFALTNTQAVWKETNRVYSPKVTYESSGGGGSSFSGGSSGSGGSSSSSGSGGGHSF